MGRKYFCYTDAGGTFIDTFVIDDLGNFCSGKASSTPRQIADGHLNSLKVAIEPLNITEEEFCTARRTAIWKTSCPTLWGKA